MDQASREASTSSSSREQAPLLSRNDNSERDRRNQRYRGGQMSLREAPSLRFSAAGTSRREAEEQKTLLESLRSGSSSLTENSDKSFDGNDAVEVNSMETGASRFGAIMNLTNCALGAGVLGLPYAFAAMGLGAAAVILAVMSLTAYYTLNILVRMARRYHINSYVVLMEHAYGRKFGIFAKWTIIFYAFGVTTGYIVIIGNNLPPLLTQWIHPESDAYNATTSGSFDDTDHGFFLSRLFLQLVVVAAIITPLAMLRNLDSLRYSSMVAIASIFYFTAVVVYRATVTWTSDDFTGGSTAGSGHASSFWDRIVWVNPSTSIFVGASIVAFALGGHMQAVEIFSELPAERRTIKTWKVISGSAVGLLNFFYLSVASIAYLTYFAATDGNILVNYPASDVLVQASLLAVTFVVVVSLPIIAWPMRRSIDMLLFRTPKNGRPPWWRLALEGIAIVWLVFLVGYLIPDLKVILSLVGATGAVLVKFLMPTAAALKLLDVSIGEKILLWFVLLTGLVLGGISTATVISDWASGNV